MTATHTYTQLKYWLGYHDSDASAESLALLHGVGGEDQGALLPLGHDIGDHTPHESPRHRVHTGRRFYAQESSVQAPYTVESKARQPTIQEDDRGLANHGNGHRQLPLVAARVSARRTVRILGQPHLSYLRIYHPIDVALIYTYSKMQSNSYLKILKVKQQQ